MVAIAYDGQCLFELGIATELFGLPRPELAVDWYDFVVVSADSGPLRALGGLSLSARHDLDLVRAAGTIVVPGWRSIEHPPPTALLDAIRDAHASGARVMSICSGVFAVAAAGLLDGRPATTHWRYTDELRERFPAVEVRPDVLFVDDGTVLTSAGSAAGIDLGLHLIRRDHGADVAARVARRLVLPPQRDGGQAQYVDRPAMADVAGGIGEVVDWMSAHLHEPITIPAMAHRANMSPRTFARRFVEQVGVTPGRWLTRERVRHAQALLETTDHSVDEVARRCGFGSAEAMRHHVRRELHTTPTGYRSAFRIREHARTANGR